jgi:tetratricopeptide (TPR) repeat protein
MRELPAVTLACVDTVNHALALRALGQSLRGLRFARTLFLSDRIPEDATIPAGIEWERIAPLQSRDDYSRFVLKSLLRHVTTPHVLLIQWDGYVVNPGAFDPTFLECDYIGAKWFWFHDGMRVGNGGFSLRSKKLLEALQDPRIELAEAEDITIGRAYRPLLEGEYDIRYASEALADRFAFEAAYPAGMPFGFHGLYNFCRVVPPAELAGLASRFSDAIARSIQLGQLLRNCVALGQWDAAAALARRRLEAIPDDDEARALLSRAEAGIASGPLVGRNDRCPCGSGKRYKQCHGAIGSRPGASASTPPRSADVAHASAPGIAPPATKSSAATLAQQGLAAHQRGDVDTAEHAYRAALAREAEHPLALHYLGVILHQRGRHAEALPLMERSAVLVPGEPEFHNNVGLVFAALDDNASAVDAYRRALDRKPDHATAWNNLGLAYQATNRLPEAIASFRRALALTPAFAHAHWNLALALLASEAYAEGWHEYEWRLRLPELGGNAPALPIPRWQGEDLRGKTLVVSAEQGIGDALQFIRFVAPLAARDVRVIVQAHEALRGLLASAAGVAATVATTDPLPACDAEIPLLSLPHRLAAGVDDVRAAGGYLRSDLERRHVVEMRFARARPGARRIGIAWAGAPKHRNDARRSMPLASLAPLLALPGIDWYSLQQGDAAAQVDTVSAAAHAVIPLDAHGDFAQTAALVDALDAVVCVDTSVAHLAGALGKPVYVLLPFAPDWRWGITGERTPWYPTARLFRQPAIGDWASAVASLHAALRKSVGSAR